MRNSDSKRNNTEVITLAENLLADHQIYQHPVVIDNTDASELLLEMKRLRIRLRDVCHCSGIHERSAWRQLAGFEPMTDCVRITVSRLIQTHSLAYGALTSYCQEYSDDLTGIGLLATRWFNHPFPLHLQTIPDTHWNNYIISYRSWLTAQINNEAEAFLQPGADEICVRVQQPKTNTEDNASADWLLKQVDELRIPLLDISLAGQISEIEIYKQLTGREMLMPTVRCTIFRMCEYYWLEYEVIWDGILWNENPLQVELLLNVGSFFPDLSGGLGAVSKHEWDEHLNMLEEAFVVDYKATTDPRDSTYDAPDIGVMGCEDSTLISAGPGCGECDKFFNSHYEQIVIKQSTKNHKQI